MRNLSGGQQQSVSIARTLFFNAKLVILDEPTSAISVRETRRVLELISSSRRKGVRHHRAATGWRTSLRLPTVSWSCAAGTRSKTSQRQDATEQVIRKIIGVEANDAPPLYRARGDGHAQRCRSCPFFSWATRS